jgi:hypothetical protein
MTRKSVKQTVRHILSAIPGGNILLRKREEFLAKRQVARLDKAKDIFGSIMHRTNGLMRKVFRLLKSSVASLQLRSSLAGNRRLD